MARIIILILLIVVTVVYWVIYILGASKNYYYISDGKRVAYLYDEYNLEFIEKAELGSTEEASIEKYQTDRVNLVGETYSELIDKLSSLVKFAVKKYNQSFTKDYYFRKSNISAKQSNHASLPNIVFTRYAIVNQERREELLRITLEAHRMVREEANVTIGNYYSVKEIKLQGSSARVTRNHDKLSYIIELKPTIYHQKKVSGSAQGEKVSINETTASAYTITSFPLAPIRVHGVDFKNGYKDNKAYYRSELIPIPECDNFFLSEMEIKVTEYNPVKDTPKAAPEDSDQEDE